MPLGELGEILDDVGGIRAEVVGAVLVNQDAGRVILVLGIATDMTALLNDGTAGAELAGEPLGKGEPGEAGADD